MQIVTLFKFGRREHLQQFREGLLYMNSSAYFAVLESDDEVRSDPLEGTSRIIQPRDTGSMTLEVRKLNLKTVNTNWHANLVASPGS
jgi:hypothetical protein